jgi:hypothetical protein
MKKFVAKVLQKVRLTFSLGCIDVQFPKSLLRSVVVVDEQLILVVILEGDKCFLNYREAYHIYSIQVLHVDLGWQCF